VASGAEANTARAEEAIGQRQQTRGETTEEGK